VVKILCFGDTHFPFAHKDIIPFLTEIKKKYNITNKDYIIHLGDELDYNALNFHGGPDPDLYSASDELRRGIKKLSELYKLFPNVSVIESNHGSLLWRRQKHHGLPKDAIKPYNMLLNAPKGWNWFNQLTIKINNNYVYFHHGKTSSDGKLSQSLGINSVQGHYHEKFQVTYWKSPTGLFFDAHVGCLVNFESLCFSYAKNNLKQPVLGCGIIINNKIILEPLIENSKKRWVGRLYA